MLQMIYGIGSDIAKVSRFESWIENPKILKRFFHPDEILKPGATRLSATHIAGCFAAKEAFSKALGTGLKGFSLNELFVQNDSEGKPILSCEGKAKALLEERVGDCKIHLTISHEKEYAIAFILIEKISSAMEY